MCKNLSPDTKLGALKSTWTIERRLNNKNSPIASTISDLMESSAKEYALQLVLESGKKY